MATVLDKAKSWAARKILNAVLVGAKTVPLDQAEARKAICRKCPYIGTVEPVYGIAMEGCTICGCPLATKAHYLQIPRLAEHKGEPLSIDELLEMKRASKDIELVLEDVICPDEVNRWAAIDSSY